MQSDCINMNMSLHVLLSFIQDDGSSEIARSDTNCSPLALMSVAANTVSCVCGPLSF